MIPTLHAAILTALLTTALPTEATETADVRATTARRIPGIDINANWRFFKGDPPSAQRPRIDDSGWEAVNLPHTWNARDGQDGGNDYYRGSGWYRKHVRLDPSLARKRLFIRFQGANTITNVYWNGEHVGQHRGGYAAFCFEITSAARFGQENVLAVRVSNEPVSDVPPLSADFTFFGGIYRPVELFATPKVCITPLDYGSPGVFVRTKRMTETVADLELIVKVSNSGDTLKLVYIVTSIHDADGKLAAAGTLPLELAPVRQYDVLQILRIGQPRLWDGRRDPHLYTVKVALVDDTDADAVEVPLGLRYFQVDPNNGFFLNGRPYDLHGVNRHQDRLNMGWAIGRKELKQDIDLICEMGCTALRLAHYQHADYVYELCDRTGLIVWAEIPLVNRISDSPSFSINCRHQLLELIRQNFNHPSIVFWGVHNEVTAQWDPGPDPENLVRELAEIVKEEDPARLSVCAGTDPLDHPANHQTEVTAFNRYFGWYGGEPGDFAAWADQYHADHPEEAIGISEYGAGASIHHHELPATKPKHDGPWHPEEWQAIVHEQHWKAMKDRPYLWAKFVWNMFDFASDSRKEGDAPGRNDKGLVTYNRKTKKDAFYWYKANWSDDPFVHITSRRFRDRTTPDTHIKIYTNCASVKLRVNGRPMGNGVPSDGIVQWNNITLSPGENRIEVVGTQDDRTYRDFCTWVYTPE